MQATDPALYPQLSAREIAAGVRTGRLSRRAVALAALARLAVVNPVLGAVCERFEPSLSGGGDGALAGVPMLLKDLNLAVAGRVTVNGSGFPAAPAPRSATLVLRWLQAGAMLLGRSHSPEFGGTSSCESRHWGLATRYPWDPALSPGGSSGGAAVAVATGIVPLAHASDAGGSITIPAALCGLVGLKPTHGLVPLGPERIEGAAGLAAQNALARDCEDAALVLAVGAARPDLARIAPLAPGLKIGVVLRAADGGETRNGIAARLETLAAPLEAAGCRLCPCALPGIGPGLAQAERQLRLASIAAQVAGLERASGTRADPRYFELATWERLQAGRRVSGTEVLDAREAILAYRARVLALFDEVDLLLSPALNTGAPHFGALSLSRPDAETAGPNRDYTCFARPWNLTGAPSLCLPLLHDGRGRPEGALFAAPPGGEALLLSLGLALQKTVGWRHDYLTIPNFISTEAISS